MDVNNINVDQINMASQMLSGMSDEQIKNMMKMSGFY